MKSEWNGYTLEELKSRRACAELEITTKRNEYMQRIHSGVNTVTQFSPLSIANVFMGSRYSPILLIKYFMTGWSIFKNVRRIINLFLKRKSKYTN
ncbi:MAG: hypothetical protein R3Y22_06645 [Bacteroidales bacterium]